MGKYEPYLSLSLSYFIQEDFFLAPHMYLQEPFYHSGGFQVSSFCACVCVSDVENCQFKSCHNWS